MPMHEAIPPQAPAVPAHGAPAAASVPASRPSIAKVVIDTLRQPDRALLATLAGWEQKNRSSDPAPSIECARALSRTVVQLVHPQLGGLSTYVVKPRALSKERARLIIGSFVYTGTRCAMPWRNAQGEAGTYTGTVRNCTHVEGRLHVIDVEFDSALERTA